MAKTKNKAADPMAVVVTEEHQAWDGGSLVPLPTPQSVQEGLAGTQGAVDAACGAADLIKVEDQATADAAAAALAVLKGAQDRIEERRKALSGPFDKWAKAINAPFNRLRDQLLNSKDRLAREWARWTEAEARKRELELEKQRERERKQEAKAVEKADRLGVDPETLIKPPAPPPPRVETHVRLSGGGSVTGKKQPSYRVINKEDVPDHLKDVIHGRVIAAIRALGQGAAKDAIPGIEISWTYGAAVRGR